MKNINTIRQTFLDYFTRYQHTIVPSSPLVPHNDPTLMFTNAGMVPFKNLFTETETRAYQRAVTTQKCLRAGGKHNDLENVGHTARHHTFFEMLGNFSFGDYFKEEAIFYAWDLVTKEFALPTDRLLVTVYSEDHEAFTYWKKIAGLPESKILKIATSDNFWSMGDTGPCGPCSEIFYDHGDHIPGGPPGSANEDGDRFVEIWNLVFMQYEQLASGERKNLPKPSIDTGMGLERITAVLQGTHDNYNIDLFQKLIATSAALTNTDTQGSSLLSHRVIADHIRAIGFLIADGILPSNEGRGYVLRRIMRRAMRHGNLIGMKKDPFLYKLVPTLIEIMGEAWPELPRAQTLITETLKTEEIRFIRALDNGLKLLSAETKHLKQGDTLSGNVIFQLYDTYGFPLDLTQDALKDTGISIDIDGFDTAMEQQKTEARKAWAGSGDSATDPLWLTLKDTLGETNFLGYTKVESDAKLLAIVQDKKELTHIEKNQEAFLIFNQTPFYGESGGQLADHGTLYHESAKADVIDVQKYADNLFVHKAKITEGRLTVGDIVHLQVDKRYRSQVAAHHSAAHLLHAALRDHFGDHITQKGSMVSNTKIRFDISHPRPLNAEELQIIEQNVNAQIIKNIPLHTQILSYQESLKTGALSLFGEKYDENVRIVSMGENKDNNIAFSIELCGGTHVKRTGDIGMFIITAESSLAAGVRRIEAVAGLSALKWHQNNETLLNQAAALLKIKRDHIPDRLNALLEERKTMEKEIQTLRKQLASGKTLPGNTAETIKDISFIGKIMDDIPPKELKGMADDIISQHPAPCVAALITKSTAKASLVVAVSKESTDRLNAITLVQTGAVAMGGKGGGGRPDMAQAGGPDSQKAEQAINAIKAAIEKA